MHAFVIAAIGLVAFLGAPQVVRAQPAGGAAAPAVVLTAPTDKAAYFDVAKTREIWASLEARKVANQRVVEGGVHSINIRIVLPNDSPRVHSIFADAWVVVEGTATAVTGGRLVNPKQMQNPEEMSGDSIEGGVEQALKPGDILYVPTGVPHGFKDLKGFRAYLIRYPSK